MTTPTTPSAVLPVTAKEGPGRNSGNYERQHRVPLELLDENPWQPRTTMDARALTELVDAIRAQGLIQAIAVKPRADGRFTIVAGHRRVEAFRRLHAEATTETARQKFAAIPASLKPALDDKQLVAQAYMENAARAALTPTEEARMVENILDKGLARTNDEVAHLLQQPLARIKRLRRLSAGPGFIKEAVGTGLVVVLHTDADGTETRELRRLDLMHALAFTRLHEHLKRAQPKKADDRVEAAVRRALVHGWSFKRCDDFVDAVLSGRAEASETADAPQAPKAVFTLSARSFAVDLARLKVATEEQLTELKNAFVEILAARGPATGQR